MPRAPSAVEQTRREMQSGGRRRDGALGAGEHRLIVAAVARVSRRDVAIAGALDIGRQRHRPVPRERLMKRLALAVKAHDHLAFGGFFHDLRREILGEDETVAGVQPPRPFRVSPPRTAARLA